MSKKSPSFGTEKNQISVKSDSDSSEVVDVKGISKDVRISNNVRKRSNILISSSDSASDCSVNIHELKQLQANGSSQMANCSAETNEGVVEISDSADNRSVSLSERFDNDSLIDRSDSLIDRCYCSDYTHDSVDSRFESSGNCDGNIIFASHDTNVYCLTNNGNLVWKFETESQVYSTPYIDTVDVKHPSSDKSVITETDNCPNNRAITNEKVVECGHIRDSPKILHSAPLGTDLDKTTHSNKFVDKLDEANARTVRDPTLNVGFLVVVAVASTKGTLYLVESEEGQVLCEMKMRNEIFSSPILYRNSLIIGCRDDNIYCFDIEAIID